MTFDEAWRQFSELQARVRAGQMAPQQLEALVGQLRVQDAAGGWWVPDVGGRGWLRWTGTAWVPDLPPAAGPSWAPAVGSPPGGAPAGAWRPASALQGGVAVAPAATAAAGPAGGPAAHVQSAVADLRQQVGDPVAFLREVRQKPLRERSQGWFDTMSILGGAISGYIWFTYGSIRGMPRLQWLGTGREAWFDFIPSGVLIALPFLALLFSSRVAAGLQRIGAYFTRLAAGAQVVTLISAIVLAWWVQQDQRFFVQREGLDFITPALMTGIPIMLVIFRKPIDRLLMPLQSVRATIPKPMLVGIGLAIPTLVAFVLYWMGYRMYPYLRMTVVVGTLLSYAVVRTPLAGVPAPLRAVVTIAGTVAMWLLCGDIAWADDFLRDPFNLNDGLRTDGAAQGLAAVATTVVTILVNGAEVTRVTIASPTPPPEGQQAEHKAFQVVVDTTDERGARSTLVDDANNQRLFVYANCVEVGKGAFPAGDPTIQFALVGADGFVSMSDLGTQYGRRCVMVSLLPTLPATPPPPSFTISVTAGAEAGGLVSASVTVTLDLGLQLVVKMEGEVPGSDGSYVVRPKGGRADEAWSWEFKPLILYFREAAADVPVAPSFIPLFSEPEVTPPNQLELGTPTSDDGKTWRMDVRLRDGVEITDEWLFSSPVFNIVVKCQEGQEMGGGA